MIWKTAFISRYGNKCEVFVLVLPVELIESQKKDVQFVNV